MSVLFGSLHIWNQTRSVFPANRQKKNCNFIWEEALRMAATTWPKGIAQCCHYSESRKKEKLDESIRPQAHSDLIYEKINTYGLNPDIVIEAKLKEQSIFKRII